MKERQLHLFNFEEDKNFTKKRYVVQLPFDLLLLLSIVLILSFILVFSWGIEKGKKIAYLDLDREQQDRKIFQVKPSSEFLLDDKGEKITEVMETKEEVKEISKETIKETNKEETKEVDTKKIKGNDRKGEKVGKEKYIIQIASYLKEDRGYQEAKKLKSKGYPVLTSKKGKYLVVYVGEFKKKMEAEKNMMALKAKYNDCILRIVKK